MLCKPTTSTLLTPMAQPFHLPARSTMEATGRSNSATIALQTRHNRMDSIRLRPCNLQPLARPALVVPACALHRSRTVAPQSETMAPSQRPHPYHPQLSVPVAPPPFPQPL